MRPKKYGESQDGEIEFVSMTKDNLKDALEAMKSSFLIHENTCRAMRLPENPIAVEELTGLCREAAKDGISIAAIHKATKRVVGFSFNKIQINAPNTTPFFDAYRATCTQPESIGIIKFMQDIDGLCDLFRLCSTDCILELMFVGTVPDFWGKRIGLQLMAASLEAGRRLRAGEDVRVPVDDGELPPKPSPKVASALFTSHKTQKIGRRLGFVVAAEVPTDKFEFEGKKLEYEPETRTVELVYKELE